MVTIDLSLIVPASSCAVPAMIDLSMNDPFSKQNVAPHGPARQVRPEQCALTLAFRNGVRQVHPELRDGEVDRQELGAVRQHDCDAVALVQAQENQQAWTYFTHHVGLNTHRGMTDPLQQ